MKITKRKLDDIRRCYCAASTRMGYENHIIYASKDPDVVHEMSSRKSFERKETIQKKTGGCMSIIPTPDREGEFLAVQEFYLRVSPFLSKIVRGKYTEGGLVIKGVLQLLYIHRSDIYRENGVNYLIGATIAASKQNKEDWSVPERIYVGVLPEDLNKRIRVEILTDGLYRNHGYYRDAKHNCGYFGSDQGIVKVTPPECKNGQWQVEYVLNGTIGEIAMLDIDGDGEQEVMTVEPFHGTEIHIYKKLKRSYQRVYTYENEIDFAHTLAGGIPRDVPTLLAGVCRRDAELFYVQCREGAFVTREIDRGVGPANPCLVNGKDCDLIVAANHTANKAAVYIVEDQEIYDAGGIEKEGIGGKFTTSRAWIDYLYLGKCIGNRPREGCYCYQTERCRV